MFPYYENENNVIEKKPVIKEIKRFSKCEIAIHPDNDMKNKTICRKCHIENMRNRRSKTS